MIIFCCIASLRLSWARFTSDLTAVRVAIGPAVIAAFDAVVMTVMVIGQMMFYVSVKLTLLAIVPMIFIAVGELYYGKIMQKRFLERQEAVSELTDFVQESFSGVRVVKAFVRERSQIRAFAKTNANAKKKNLMIARMAFSMPVTEHPSVTYITPSAVTGFPVS